MKKNTYFLICFFIVALSVNAFARGLNSEANYIKENFPMDYEKTIKTFALNKWNDNYKMVVYEINKQAKSLVTLIDEFKSENTRIAGKAILKWSIKGEIKR